MKELVIQRLQTAKRHARKRTKHHRMRIAAEARGRVQAYTKAIQLVKGIR